MSLATMSQEELRTLLLQLRNEYEHYRSLGLELNMSRGKPDAVQLDLSMKMMTCLDGEFLASDGSDTRNYGDMDGIPEAKKLLGNVLDLPATNIIIYGSSSLNIMYDKIVQALLFGVSPGSTPWGKQKAVKFLCPVPGYDRHFAICEQLGIEMINIPMTPAGPDMDQVEALASHDPGIKGIWCVPKYSNPQGYSYSGEVVSRLAAMPTAADDFRIFWDNAYGEHHLYPDQPDVILNIAEECQKAGYNDRYYMFCSTSKITFAGAGIAGFGSSEANIAYAKKLMSVQIISHDKVNQLRHVRFLKNIDGLHEHMKKHAELLRPKFDTVINCLQRELAGLGCCDWTTPRGGYFLSFNAMPGCAKKIVQMCGEAGVELTGAGATFPYGHDPEDKNIRIAPTYPPLDELAKAAQLFCLCVKIVSVEKLLSAK